VRACGHAGMRACGHAGMRACGHAGMRACGVRLDERMDFVLSAIAQAECVDLRDMSSRLVCTPRLAAAVFTAAALALTAPAVGLASTTSHHAVPTAHIALGLMDSHVSVRHSFRHQAVKKHRQAAEFTATSW